MKGLINDSYDSLRKPDILIPLFNYVFTTDWRNVTGKVISSNEFEINEEVSKFELDFEKNNNFNMYDNHKDIHDKKENFPIGENYLGMSPEINKFLKSYNWDFSKYSKQNNKLIKTLSVKYNVPLENIILNNGTIITLFLILSKFIKKYHDVICNENSWILFNYFSNLCNLNVIKVKEKILNNKLIFNWRPGFGHLHSTIMFLIPICFLP